MTGTLLAFDHHLAIAPGAGSHQCAAVRAVLDRARSESRMALIAPEARAICEAYGIAMPPQETVKTADEAADAAERTGFPVALKIVSKDILHKTDAGGVSLGLKTRDEVKQGFAQILKRCLSYQPEASIDGVQVQGMVSCDREVIIGAVTDPSFGKLVAFGLGGIFVEVLKDITFRLAPVTKPEALAMLDSIRGADILKGVRGAEPVDRGALAGLIVAVSKLVSDFPDISEVDLNPVFADPDGAVAVDARIVLSERIAESGPRQSRSDILRGMNRIMKPKSIAVIGASAEEGKIGHSVMKNLVDGGYPGSIYPINPNLEEVLGRKVFKSVLAVPEEIDLAVFAIPAKFVAAALEEVGRKKIAGAVMIPSGFAEIGNLTLQNDMMAVAKKHGVRVMGPNIYGFYYLPEKLCATFCTPYDVSGHVALSSQSGGVGMSIIGFGRSTKMGVSAIVGLGNKADIDETDLLTFFEQDDQTHAIAMHMEDLKDGRAFVEIARRVGRRKPIIVLKAGRTAIGARAAASHTGALAGNDKIYGDLLRQAGVIRARSLNEMLQFAHGVPVLATPRGENVLIITGAGGSGVLLSDACEDYGLKLMRMPKDLDAAFRKFIPPFGAAGNPVDITGGEPPSTYENTIRLALEDERIHALILGYWHTIVSPPMVFAEVVAKVVEQGRARGIDKPIVASLVGDVEVERACDYLYERGIVAYAYTTELPVAVLGAKYQWARGAGYVRA
jgi:acetyl coenzyme A synthetase (ADP forming)-like protein